MSCCGVVTSSPYHLSPTSRLVVSTDCKAAAAADMNEELSSIASVASAAVFASFKSSASPTSARGGQLQNASRDHHSATEYERQSVAMEACAGPVHFERRERVLLRPWLENLIDSGKVPGLEWLDNVRSKFKVPWKHRSKKNWSMLHSCVFLEWAKNTGRWREGDPEPNYAQLKTRLRCAFNKAPDIEEMKELHSMKCDEPYKVYRFIPRRDGRTRPFARTFVTRASIPIASRKRRRRLQLQPGVLSSMSGTADVKGLRPESVGDCGQMEVTRPLKLSNQLLNHGCKEDAWKSQMWKCSDPQLYQTDYMSRLATSQHNGGGIELVPVAIKAEMTDDEFFKSDYEEFPPELTSSRRILPDVNNSCEMFPPPCRLPLAPSASPSAEVAPRPVVYKEAKITSSDLVEHGVVGGVRTTDDIDGLKYGSVKPYGDVNRRYCNATADMVAALYKDEYYRQVNRVEEKYTDVVDPFNKHRAVTLQSTNSISSNNSASLSSPRSECSTVSSGNETANHPSHAAAKQVVAKVDENASAPRLHRFKQRYMMEQLQLQQEQQTAGDAGEAETVNPSPFSDCSSQLANKRFSSAAVGSVIPRDVVPASAPRTLPAIDLVDSIALLNVGLQSTQRSGNIAVDEAVADRSRFTGSMSDGNLQRYESSSWRGDFDGNETKRLDRSRQPVGDSRVFFARMPSQVSGRGPEFYTDEELQQCYAKGEAIYQNGEPVSYSPPLSSDSEAVDLSPESDAIDLSKKSAVVTPNDESYYSGHGQRQRIEYLLETQDPVRVAKYNVQSSPVYYQKPTARDVDDKAMTSSLLKTGHQQLNDMERQFEFHRREVMHVLPEFAQTSDYIRISPTTAVEAAEVRGGPYPRYREQAGFNNSCNSSSRPMNNLMVVRTDKPTDAAGYLVAKRSRIDDEYVAVGRGKEDSSSANVLGHGPFLIRRQTVDAVERDALHSRSDSLAYGHDADRHISPGAARGGQFSMSDCERLLGTRKRTRNFGPPAGVTNSGNEYPSAAAEWAEEREMTLAGRTGLTDAKYELSPKQNHYVISSPQSYAPIGPNVPERLRRASDQKNREMSPPERMIGARTPAASPARGQIYTNERPRSNWSTSVNGMLSTVPTPVRQLVASAAGTTAASILPPLSPGGEENPADLSPTGLSAACIYSPKGNQPTVYLLRKGDGGGGGGGSGSGFYNGVDRVDGTIAFSGSPKRQTMRFVNGGMMLSNGGTTPGNEHGFVVMLPNKAQHYYRQHALEKPPAQQPTFPGFSRDRSLPANGGRDGQLLADGYSIRMTAGGGASVDPVYRTAEYKDVRRPERDRYD